VRDDAYNAILQYAGEGGFVFCLDENCFRYNPYGKSETGRLSQLKTVVE